MNNNSTWPGIESRVSNILASITGYLEITVEESYSFRLSATEIAYVMMDNDVILHTDIVSSVLMNVTTTIQLSPGYHLIEIHYAAISYPSSTLSVEWSVQNGEWSYITNLKRGEAYLVV